MTHHPGFLADILAHPDDDTTRLIYADWLDDNGQPERAEFIRVQVELAKLEPCEFGGTSAGGARCFCGCRRCELVRRSDSLVSENGDSWVLPDTVVGSAMWRWERGFISCVDAIYAADWIEHGDNLLTRHPIRAVILASSFSAEELGWLYGYAREKQMISLINDEPKTFMPNPFDAASNLACIWPRIKFTLPPQARA